MAGVRFPEGHLIMIKCMKCGHVCPLPYTTYHGVVYHDECYIDLLETKIKKIELKYNTLETAVLEGSSGMNPDVWDDICKVLHGKVN